MDIYLFSIFLLLVSVILEFEAVYTTDNIRERAITKQNNAYELAMSANDAQEKTVGKGMKQLEEKR